jgi:hypothetical protein
LAAAAGAAEPALVPPGEDRGGGLLLNVDEEAGLRAPMARPPERGMVERGREGVRAFTEGVARKVDSWFGDKPFEEGGKVSGSIGFNFLVREDEGFRSNLRFRARLDLPNLKEKGYLFFGQDNERELITDQPEAFTRQQQLLAESRRQDQSYFAGLAYSLRDNLEFRAGVRGGYKVYTQARYRKSWVLSGKDGLDFRETLFWTVDEGFGSTTALAYEHAYSPSLAFRWRTAGTFSEDTDGLGWSTSVGMFKSFQNERLVSLEGLVHGETGSSVGVAEYGVRAIWRQPIYREWMLLSVTVGHFWPQDEDDAERRRSWAMGAGIEILF